MRTEAYQAGLLVKHIDQATPYHWSQPTLEKRLRDNPNGLKVILVSLALSTGTLVCFAIILALTTKP